MSLIKSLIASILIILFFKDYTYSQSKLVINEILAEPSADANGDATFNADDDEFVELVNVSGTSVDITGWTLSDNTSVRYTFPSTTVPAGGAVIVFGGGTPTGLFGGAILQTAATLDLDNSGDVVYLKNGSVIIDKYVYGTEADNGQSIARSPDLTGSFVQHTTLAGALSFSPGKSNTNNANSFPLTTTVTASMIDALVTDINSSGNVNPGEQIEYTVTVTNTGTQNAASVNLNNTVDANTTFVPGSIKTTPLALTDYYNTDLNTALNPNAASGVLANDSDPDGSGAVTVISYGTSAAPNATNVGGGPTATDQSGSVTVSADGSFAYTPPNNQTGLDKFGYRIEDTDNNIQSANVEINIFGTAPSAVADNYSVLSATLLTVPDGGTDLLSNDNLGIPNGVLTSFGGGTTGGAVTTNAAGATFSGSGHSLTVNANGSFTFTSASGFTGSFTFQYRVKNEAGFSDGLVTISVQSVPIAVNDPNGGLPVNSTPPAGANPNPYHTALNTTLNVVDGVDDLLNNDDLGSPAAAIVSYGTTGNPNAQTTIGNSTPTNNGGTVTINANGSFTYNPPNATYTGTDQFAYKIQNVQGSSIGTVTVAVGFRPSAVADSYGGSGNIAIALNAAGGVILGTGTDVGDQITVTEVQGLAGNVGVAAATTATGRSGIAGFVTLAADGSFTYEPPPGFVGNDTYAYKVGNGFGNSSTATVTITISNMVWFISNTGGGLNRGTFSNPFTTIAAFNTANAATGIAPDPKNGDVIALRTGSGTYTEADGVNLRDSQKLIGEAVQFNTVFTANANSTTAYNSFASTVGTAPTIVTNAGTNHGVDLAQNNTVRGLSVGNTTGFGFNGTAVGSPVINTVSKTGNGGAINVSTSGAFSTNVTFDNLSSTNSASQGINLVGVTGTLTVTAGSITNPTGTAVNVNGGSVSLTYPGNITQSNNASTVSASNGHSGTLTFQTGTINSTNGNGLQYDNSDGTYNFNGTTTLNGGDAGVNILNGSAGTFTFGTGTTITNPVGIAFNVDGTSATVTSGITYSGSITQANNFAIVNVKNHTTGTITFQTGTLSATNGTGLQFDNADSPTSYNFNGTTTLNGGDAALDILNGSAGTFSFASGASIINPTNEAIKINASTANITYSGSFTKNNNAVNGILVNGETAGAITINGTGTKTLSTSTANAISLTTNTGTSINFSGNNLSLTTTTGIGFNATGGATAINVTGTGNTITSTTGTALNVTSSTIGASNLNFQSISSNGATSGIILTSTGTTGGLVVTGTGGANSGGTIQNTTGSGILASNTFNLSLTRMQISAPALHGIDAPNLSGTCLVSNCSILNWVGATSNGINVVNLNDNLSSLTVTATTFNGTASNNDGIFMEAQGTSSMALTVNGSCVFTDMFGDGIQVNGITGATGNVSVTVMNSTFNNAAALGNGGISLQPFGGINFTALIDGNTFDNIMLPVTNLGAIGGTNGLTAVANITIQNNTLNNIVGARGITFSADGTGLSTLVIDNNNIDRLGSTSKYAIQVNMIGSVGVSSPGKVTVTNNDIGQAANLWTSGNGSAEAIFFLTQNSSTMQTLVSGNVVTANANLEVIRARSIGSSTQSITYTGNTVTDNVGSHVGELAVKTEGTATLCMNASSNTLPGGGTGVILITETAGTINVTQASAAAVAAANSGATVTVSGTPTYGVAPCITP